MSFMMRFFKPKQNTAVGLDIGKDSIKLVELKRQGETITLTKMDSVKIADSSGGVSQMSVQLLKKTITGLFNKNRIKNKKVILNIDGQSVFLKFLEVLPVGREKLGKTIKYEAQQQIPFSLAEVEWDAHLFVPGLADRPSASLGFAERRAPRGEQAPADGSSSVRRVLLAAVKKDKLTGMRELIKESGLLPLSLEVGSLSLYNCLAFNQDYAEDKLNVAVNIGARATDMLVIEGGRFWMRSFAVGGDNFTEALSKKQNIDFAAAEKIKRGIAVNSADSQGVWDSILKDLQGEISRSLDYYDFQRLQTSSLPEEGSAVHSRKIEQIILSGAASQMSGLDKFLSEAFLCRVRVAEPFKVLKMDAELKKTICASQKALFTQAVGLALRGIGASFIDINLLKEHIKSAQTIRRKLVYDAGSIILTLSVILGVSAFMRQEYKAKSLRLERLKLQLNSLNMHQPQVRELYDKTVFLSFQCNLLQNLAVNRSLWLEGLKEFTRILPANLWITDFSGTGSFDTAAGKYKNALQIEGRASTYDEVNDFVAKLKSSRIFTEVKPVSSTFIEEAKDDGAGEVVKFSISMEVKNR
ncbi:MAG: pilus assembly protein PilM [Candidatus Omnitrophota bacterium]